MTTNLEQIYEYILQCTFGFWLVKLGLDFVTLRSN